MCSNPVSEFWQQFGPNPVPSEEEDDMQQCDHHPDAICSLCRYLKSDERERARRNLIVMRQLAVDGRQRRSTDLQQFHDDASALRARTRTGIELLDSVHRWYTEAFGADATDGREDIPDHSTFA